MTSTEQQTLAGFLLERIAEDEATAGPVTIVLLQGDVKGESFARRWDSARVLAECEAKRRIIDAYLDAKHHYDEEHDADGSVKYADGAVWEYLAKLETWEQALRLLASPYSDHPAFRQEWQV